ncbi:MAG: beta-lactamase family protein [Oscillospiraceae bacterium]|nr:beta-lactamase family protein [Oscillospiraceae bacterium]
MNAIKGKTDCKPIETGYDESRIEKLDSRLSEMIEKKLIHGAAYCISHKGKVIAHGAVGRNNGMGIDTPMKPDTVFGIASITKTFTAAAIMQLVEDGYIRLNTPVGEILPQFSEKPFDGITLWHLLTHTSGLYPDGGCFPESAPKDAWELIEAAAEKWDGKSDFDWITAGISAGLRRPTGKEWQYCSFGFALLGEVVSRVSGMNVHDYIEEKIMRPLKMQDSGFYFTPETAARGFVDREEHKKYLESIVKGEINGRDGEGSVWDKIPMTGGGIHSTVYDLVRYGNAFIYGGRFEGGRILGRKSVEKMSTVQLHNIPDHCWGADEPNHEYGVGFDIRRTLNFSYSDRTIMHEGAGASSLDIDLDEQLVAAWFVPFDEGANGWSAEPLYNVQNIIWSGLI